MEKPVWFCTGAVRKKKNWLRRAAPSSTQRHQHEDAPGCRRIHTKFATAIFLTHSFSRASLCAVTAHGLEAGNNVGAGQIGRLKECVEKMRKRSVY